MTMINAMRRGTGNYISTLQEASRNEAEKAALEKINRGIQHQFDNVSNSLKIFLLEAGSVSYQVRSQQNHAFFSL